MIDTIKIYIADDHQIIIDGIMAVLKNNSSFEVVGFSLNGINLIEDAKLTGADILIMDLTMPKKNGLEVLKELSKSVYPFKVIVLSSFDDLKLVEEVIKLGATSYITKQCAAENISEAILNVYANEEYFCTTIREKILKKFAFTLPKKQVGKSNFLPSLSERELTIITLISMEYSGKEISECLFISMHTVESHRKNLIKKLNVKGSVGLVKYAIKNNLIEL